MVYPRAEARGLPAFQRKLEPPKVDFPVSPGHFDEFVRAIRGGDAAWSNFPEIAGPLTETVLVGNLAVWVANSPGVGPKIEWDAANQRVKNHNGLERLIQREYRAGYSLWKFTSFPTSSKHCSRDGLRIANDCPGKADDHEVTDDEQRHSGEIPRRLDAAQGRGKFAIQS